MSNKISSHLELIICIFSFSMVMILTAFGFGANINSVEASSINSVHSVVKNCNEFVHHRVN